jgi:hypothetical protein
MRNYLTMIKPNVETRLSIRNITFDGATQLENQQRGSDIFKVHYQILAKKTNMGTGKEEWTIVSDHNAIFNGEFKDEEAKEAIIYFKQFAVKLIQESNFDQSKNIDHAIEQIEAGN